MQGQAPHRRPLCSTPTPHPTSHRRYRGLLAALLRHRPAMYWQREEGGRAFEYTLLALRRRRMALKALHAPERDADYERLLAAAA